MAYTDIRLWTTRNSSSANWAARTSCAWCFPTMILPSESPPPIRNRHCPGCQYLEQCQAVADVADSIGWMRGVTAKLLARYERKGIFSIKQLSFLYRPPKKSRNPRARPLRQNIELQALAIRTGKTYISELPNIKRTRTEVFLDLEGDPDRSYYYLFGLLICTDGRCEYESFWSSEVETEKSAWSRFLERLRQTGDAPKVV